MGRPSGISSQLLNKCWCVNWSPQEHCGFCQRYRAETVGILLSLEPCQIGVFMQKKLKFDAFWLLEHSKMILKSVFCLQCLPFCNFLVCSKDKSNFSFWKSAKKSITHRLVSQNKSKTDAKSLVRDNFFPIFASLQTL